MSKTNVVEQVVGLRAALASAVECRRGMPERVHDAALQALNDTEALVEELEAQLGVTEPDEDGDDDGDDEASTPTPETAEGDAGNTDQLWLAIKMMEQSKAAAEAVSEMVSAVRAIAGAVLDPFDADGLDKGDCQTLVQLADTAEDRLGAAAELVDEAHDKVILWMKAHRASIKVA